MHERVTASEPRETSGVTTRLILAYVRARGGMEAQDAVLVRARLSPQRAEELADEGSWSSYATKVGLFDAAAAVLDDPDVARRIGASPLSLGIAAPLQWVIARLGSPQQVLRSIPRANARFSACATMRALGTGPGHAVISYRLHDGHVPSRHDCGYTQGLLTQTTVLFGLPPARIVHDQCQVKGAPECRYELTWPARGSLLARLRGRARQATLHQAVLSRQLEDLQRAGVELVTCRDLDVLLERIAMRAGSAVRAQRFLLAVQLEGECTPRVHADGFSPVEAALAGRALLSATADQHGRDRLVATVASGPRRYGMLAAYLPGAHGFLPGEQVALDAYAGLAAAALDSATAFEAARRRGQRSEALLGLAQRLVGVRDEREVATAASEAVLPVLGADTGSVLLWRPEEGALVTAGTHGFPEHLRQLTETYRIDLHATPELDSMLRAPSPRLYSSATPDAFVRQSLEIFTAEVVGVAPIIVRGEFLGTLHARWADRSSMPPDAEGLLRGLSSLADQTGMAIVNLRMVAEVHHRATHDALTGLANRALFRALLSDALARGRREGGTTAVCFLDLDDFKDVNDTHGHAVGDAILATVAERLRTTVRGSDVIARLSGDEFGIVLHGHSAATAAATVAAKVIDAISEPFEGEGFPPVHVGISIGIALAPEHGVTPEALLAYADTAMYEAKTVGSTHRTYQPDRPGGVMIAAP